jgi:hypothetical protein
MRPFILIAAGVLTGAFLLQPRSAAAHGFEASAGFYTNYDPDFNEFFGASFAARLAYSLPLSPNDVHVFAEVGYVHGDGPGAYGTQGFYIEPTVALLDSTGTLQSSFTLWPVTLGIRTNLVPSRYRSSVGLYLGLGMVTMFTRYENVSGTSSTTPVLGGMVELRPQVRVSSAVALWIDPRLVFVSDAKYSGGPDINFGGSTLEFGVTVGKP